MWADLVVLLSAVMCALSCCSPSWYPPLAILVVASIAQLCIFFSLLVLAYRFLPFFVFRCGASVLGVAGGPFVGWFKLFFGCSQVPCLPDPGNVPSDIASLFLVCLILGVWTCICPCLTFANVANVPGYCWFPPGATLFVRGVVVATWLGSWSCWFLLSAVLCMCAPALAWTKNPKLCSYTKRMCWQSFRIFEKKLAEGSKYLFYNGIYNGKNLQKLKIFILGTKIDYMSSYEALLGWGSGKVFLDIIFKIQENMLKMILNTIDMLLIQGVREWLSKVIFS